MAYIGKKPAAAALTSSDISDGIITNAKLAQDIISADTALGAEPADTDEFLVSDAGVLKRMDYSYIKGGGYTQATAVSASGSTISFTGIPAGTKSILITGQNLSTDSGAGSDFKMTIGDSGGLETSSYSSVDMYRGSGGDTGFNTSTSYFKMSHGFSASDVWS